MYLCLRVKGALQILRVLEEDVIGDVHLIVFQLRILKPASNVWCVHEFCAFEPDDKPGLRMTEVVPVKILDCKFGVVEQPGMAPVLLQIVAELDVDVGRVGEKFTIVEGHIDTFDLLGGDSLGRPHCLVQRHGRV